jgi:pyruvate,water dikinase
MQNFIIPFTNHTLTLDQAGGKGLNLSKTARGGFRVPPGFIITTEAYRLFAQTNQIEAGIRDQYRGLAVDDPASLEKTSQAIRRLFEAGHIPQDIQTETLHAYHELCQQADNTPVAVRSSATAEDLAGASFAGQQDTYLNIKGDVALMEAVKHCWASLWTARAISYRANQKIDPGSVSLAVVIQQMVPAESAGVMFTANPITGARDEIVIDASWGLGEAIVGSLVVPDHIVVSKENRKVTSLTIADKTVMTVRTEDGTQERPVPAHKRKAQTLSVARTAELAELGGKIEQYYVEPQDIEWCFANGQFYIVQVRPITSLPPEPLKWAPPGEGLWMHGGGTFEMITEPITPLFETFLLPIFVESLIQMLADIGLKDALPEVPYRIVNGFIYLHIQMHLRPWHLPGIIKDFALHLNSMQNQETEQTQYHETVSTLCQPAIADLTSEQILARMQALGEAGMRYWIQIMKIVQVIYRQEKAFTDFYQRVRWPGDAEPEIFLRGQKIKPWEAECSTFELAQLAQTTPSVAGALQANPETALDALKVSPDSKAFLSALEAHLGAYGHQLSSFDLYLPTLADDPRPVLVAIQSFLNGKESPYTRQERMASVRERAKEIVLKRLSTRDQKKFKQVLVIAQNAACIRENALFDVGLAWTQMRRCALELGNRLVQAGAIARVEDVFWLKLDEIHSALSVPESLIPAVTERRANTLAWTNADAPYLLPAGSKPGFWWKWIFPTPELNHHPDAHTLVGLGVSPGKVTAVARVIHSLDEMQRINAGEILVTRTTTPAWTPLFARIAGLVTDLGGPLAHGSIVAREYGIPAVMGTGSATQRIQDGGIITVDGTTGRVELS